MSSRRDARPPTGAGDGAPGALRRLLDAGESARGVQAAPTPNVQPPTTAARGLTTHNSQPTTLNERQLSALWRGRRFPDGALVTRAGVPVTVISGGRPGRGPGPDYRGAVIAGPSGVPLRGDVELHVRTSDFRAHGHGSDPAYAGIVLHVVFEDDDGEDTLLPGGGTAPVVALAPWVARRAGELQHWLERPPLWREPCHDAVARAGVEDTGHALDSEGDRRFGEKVVRMADAIAARGLEQALYGSLLEALGYGGNAAPMRALAVFLPWSRLGAAAERADHTELEALLIGAAGLLPSQRHHDGHAEPHVVDLEARFAAAGLMPLPDPAWKLWGVRPSNLPARRLAGAAALLAALRRPSALLALAGARNAAEAVAPLCAPRASGYWLRHTDTAGAASRLPPAFIGRSRALEVLVNVVLPAAVAAAGPAAAPARALFEKLPRPASYGATRFIESALASGGQRVPVDARRALGLLALHRDWCTQGGCGRCPLSRE